MTKKISQAQRKKHQKVNNQKRKSGQRKSGSMLKQPEATRQKQEPLLPLRQVVITEAKSYGDEPGQDIDREIIIEHALLCAIDHELGFDPSTYTIVRKDPVPFFPGKPTSFPWSHSLYYTDSAGDEDMCGVWSAETTPPAGTPYTHCFYFAFDEDVSCHVYRTQASTYAAQAFVVESAEPELETTRKVVEAALNSYDSDKDDHLFQKITVRPFTDDVFGRSWRVTLDQEEVEVVTEKEGETLTYTTLLG